MQNILITGGAGLIGRNLIQRLSAREDLNLILILKPERRIDFQHPDNITTVYGDLRDIRTIEDTFSKNKPTKVIHLAAKSDVKQSLEDPQLYEENNIRATLNLIELSQQHQVSNFIFASTGQVYDEDSNPPFSEDSSPANKQKAPYIWSKRACELLGYTYSRMSDISFTCLRLFNVYGPYMRKNLAVHQLIEKSLAQQPFTMQGDGTASRDYVHVSDVVSAIERSIDIDSSFEIINIGSSRQTTLRELIKIVENVTEREIIINRGERHNIEAQTLYADITKARNLLRWKPKISLEEGIRQYAEWYQTERPQNL